MKKNSVFIARSIDGFIADKNGGIDWLHMTPNPTDNDMGYEQFLAGMDAVVMGYQTMSWPVGRGRLSS